MIRYLRKKNYTIRKRNTPIAQLIRLYEDKRSGKVMVAREEIRWRFEALDWKYQKRILTAFLQSGKMDREWACSWLRYLWDPCFELKVKELWEQYHEESCRWVVIRCMPLDYVKHHMHEFTRRRDYYYICLRMAQDKSYQIDTTKLSTADYIAVLFHTGRSFDCIDTKTIFYQIVHECCLRSLHAYDFDKPFEFNHPADILCPSDLRDINRVKYYFMASGFDYENNMKYYHSFMTWNEQVKEAICTSKEYQQLLTYTDHPYFLDEWMRCIMRKYTYISLPDEYKRPDDPPIEDMIKPADEYMSHDNYHPEGTTEKRDDNHLQFNQEESNAPLLWDEDWEKLDISPF